MNKNYITINVESIDNEDTIRANFKSGIRNYSQLIQLGGALLNTFLASSTEIIKKNDKELDIPDEIVQLSVLEAIIDKVYDLIQVNADNEDNDTKVDDFLSNILKGMKGDEE